MSSRFHLVFRFLLASTLWAVSSIRAQDITLAGWTFSQFLGEGAPSINAETFESTGFIVATYRGDINPLSSVVDGTVVSLSGGTGYSTDSIGSWSFTGFDINNADDVRADTFGALNTINSTTSDSKQMHLTDSAGMMLTFRKNATLWGIQVNNTTGYTNAGVDDFTFAARGNDGAATVEWLFNDVVFATTNVTAGSFNVYSAELPSQFYGNGQIQGRLVSGKVSFDNVQINGQLGTPPQFNQQPQPLVRNVGQSATFSAAVSGANDPTFQWFKGDTAIVGATGSSYTLAAVTLNDDASYRVTVRSSNGLTADSNAARLEVRQAPVISRQPASQSANPGQTVTFSVLSSGTPSPAYRWQRGGIDLVEGGSLSGVNGPVLTISGVTEGDAGDYRVVVTNVVDSVTSSIAALAVENLAVAPAVSTAPVDVVGVQGGRAEFSVVASGAPAPTFRWKFEGGDLVDGPGVSGASTDRLVLENLTVVRAGTYSVIVENSAGSVERAAELVVQLPPSVVSGPGPASRFVAAGSDVTFTVAAAGDPAPAFQWLRNGDVLVGQTEAMLTLRGVTIADEGLYSVRLSNAASSIVSAGSELRVGSAARILSSPLSAVGTLGGAVTLNVVAEGAPAPTYQWFRDGNPLTDSTESSLTVSNLSAADAGSYTVRVANEFATIMSEPAELRVAQPVSISRPGQTQTFTPGSTLVIGAPGAPNNSLRYEWYRDGLILADASASQLTISDASFSDGGAYSLKIYNTKGKLVSSRVVARISISVANGYDVLLRDASSGAPAGVVRLDVARAGVFTGRLQLVDGSVHALKGAFAFTSSAVSGQTTIEVRRKGASTLSLALDLEVKLAELGCALGEGGVVKATGSADRRLTGSAAWAGAYSLELGYAGSSPSVLSVKITSSGALGISGRLTDGARVSFSAPASVSGAYAVLLLPYRKGAGHMAGELRLVSSSAGYFADEESSGLWRWRRLVSNATVESSVAPMLTP